mgnify:CR=1 FL=1
MYIYVFGLRQLQPASRRDRTPAPAHALREARWRLCRKHSGVPRSRVSLPKTCTERLWRRQRRRARFQSGSTSSSPPRDIFSIPLPLFYSPRREAVIIRYIMFYSLSFRTGIRLDFLPNECVLPRISPQPTCTYLRTIQQNLCLRVRADLHTLYSISA